MAKSATSTARIPATVGKPTAEIEQAWINRQILYENFAGKVEDLDNRVAALVRQHCNSYRNRMGAVFDRMALNWRCANGDVPWLTTMDGVHMFEGQKALQRKCSSIVNTIVQFDPAFIVEGDASEVDQREAEVIQAWTNRKLENAGWQDLLEPVARAGELTNMLVVKVGYERQKEMLVDRSVKLDTDAKKATWVDKRTISNRIGKRGCRVDQVDSFWFFYDLEGKNAQECSFIGDESEPFLHDLEAQADLGIYSKEQLKKVGTARRTKTPTGQDASGNWVDAHRNARSVALGNDQAGAHPETESQHEAVRIRLVEDWCFFNFGDGFDGVVDPMGNKLTGVHRVLITLADDIVIRFMLNPNDRKVVPYAFERVNDNGAGAFAPAPFDAVTQINMDYDRFATGMYRWTDTLTTPFIAVRDQGSGWPSSMLGIKTGTVVRNAGDFEVIRQPDITPAVMAIRGTHRQEIEEASGALRVYESPSNTATESTFKVQEQQHLVRNSIRANCKLWAQVALIVKAMEAQYASGEETFAVVGKAATAIEPFVTITPDTMLKDVRFRFIGMNNMHVIGDRKQGFARWSNRWQAALPGMPKIDVYELARLDFELEVGTFGADRIFPTSASPFQAIPQEQENVALLAGHSVDVNEQDDDIDHLKKLVRLLERKDLPEYVRERAMQHYMAHAAAHERKQAEQQAAEQEAQREAAMLAPQGGQPGADRPPAFGGMPAKRDPGITPGPEGQRSSARGGRSQPAQQTAMMPT
jgi:hypothetical protein